MDRGQPDPPWLGRNPDAERNRDRILLYGAVSDCGHEGCEYSDGHWAVDRSFPGRAGDWKSFTILQSCAPFEKVGIWTGAENFAGNLAGIVAPLAVGLLIKRSGSYVPGFELGAIVLLVGLLAYWFIVGELKPDVAE